MAPDEYRNVGVTATENPSSLDYPIGFHCGTSHYNGLSWYCDRHLYGLLLHNKGVAGELTSSLNSVVNSVEFGTSGLMNGNQGIRSGIDFCD